MKNSAVKIAAILSVIIVAVILLGKTRISAFGAYEGEKEVYLSFGSFSEKIKKEGDNDFIFALLRKKGEACSVKNADRKKIENDFSALLVFEEQTEEVKSYYYYSEKLPCCVILSGKRVNLQITERGKELKAGTPMIYGSF